MKTYRVTYYWITGRIQMDLKFDGPREELFTYVSKVLRGANVHIEEVTDEKPTQTPPVPEEPEGSAPVDQQPAQDSPENPRDPHSLIPLDSPGV